MNTLNLECTRHFSVRSVFPHFTFQLPI